MVVLRVKAPEEGILRMEPIVGPVEVVEGEDAEFRITFSRARKDGQSEDSRIDFEATVTPAGPNGGRQEAEGLTAAPPGHELPGQVVYLADQPMQVTFRFRLDANEVTPVERRAGTVRRILTVTASYQDGRKMHRKSRTHCFSIQLNAEQVIRRVGNLGAILGLTPKTLRGG
jgi:hypothetical protein